MSKVIVFAGTTEGRKLSEWLCKEGIFHTLCVATEYGEQVLTEHPAVTILRGRMNEEEMEEFFLREGAKLAVDATHPYAAVVTENIRLAAKQTGVSYLRLLREGLSSDGEKNSFSESRGYSRQPKYFQTPADCADYLAATEGTIFLTTGSKDLAVFTAKESVKSRLIARVLPGTESIGICERQGLLGKQIVAMQGPFSQAMNLALLTNYNAKILVTKASGRAGGFQEKLDAAGKLGVQVCIIGRPVEDEGESFESVCQKIRRYCDIRQKELPQLTFSLIGCGMGHPECLTVEASETLEKADVVFGARRLLSDMKITNESYPWYLAKDILPFLEKKVEECGKLHAAILFSGDSGFFSGTKKMNQAIEDLRQKNQYQVNCRIYPGISSISNLAAAVGESWEDARILSIHGKGPEENWRNLVVQTVKKEKKTFLLLSGVRDLQTIGRLLEREENIIIYAGYQMSYPEEEILTLTARECRERTKEGLYALFILNEKQPIEEHEGRIITHGLSDTAFLRGKVPMTKEEVRTISISKLNLREDSVVYDIGCGTGSVAVEMARLSDQIRVYGIERKEEALELIEKNREKFGLSNLTVVSGLAPEALLELPVPTHAFIGGSGGHLKEILTVLFEKNPKIRIVANAVSLETLQELMEIEKRFQVEDFDLLQLSATRTRVLGSYHMMQGENPIWICSFTGNGE